MKLLVVDDHPLMREGIAAFLAQSVRGAVVLQAAGLAEAMALRDAHPDVTAVLLDLLLPGVEGMDGVKAIRRRWASLPIIVLTAAEHASLAQDAIDAGASAFASKTSNRRELIETLRAVLAQSTAAAAPVWRGGAGLTPRQSEVLRLLCDGMPNKQVAAVLGMSDRTVKVHVTAIFRALDVVNRTQAVIAARAGGLY